MMTMEANELRIGNLVYDKNMDLHLISVNDFYKLLEPTMGGGNMSELKPIPLTEEWLLKFGFEKNNEYWYMNHVFCINKYFDAIDIKVNILWQNIYGIKIRYVHQLQNLYFALTGQELTFKE